MLLIDSRIGSREIAAYLPTGSYELTYLDSGDATFLGHGPDGPMTYPIAIERKRTYDLLDSFKTGRLNTQIQRMSGAYKQIYLIVEGRFRVNKDNQHILVPVGHQWKESKLTYAMIDMYLNTLVDERHIKLKYAHNLQETAWQVWNIYTHANSEAHSSHLKMDTTWEVNPFMPASFEKRVAAQLDGIGDNKAALVANQFCCVYGMCMADKGEWEKLKGIGPLIAKRVTAQLKCKNHQ